MILRPTASAEEWKGFLAKPDLHWKPGRSAMEAAYAWERAAQVPGGYPPEIAAFFPGVTCLQAVPEFKVDLPGGKAASQNDVFALLRDEAGLIVLMVEAKRDESFDRTLGEWLVNASAGKRDRIAHIFAVLGLEAAKVPPTIRYQLLQRAAAAVMTARQYHAGRAAMVVQSFSPEHRWHGDFAAFAALFGIRPEVGQALTVALGDLTLTLGWAHCPLTTEVSP